MIDSISIAGVATYANSPETMGGLSKFNFVYGANGCGKTTITRVIADETNYPSCSVQWKNGTKLEAMAYNRDFVEKNFATSELKGIFTLGEKNIDILNKIAVAKKERDELTREIEALNKNLHGNDNEGGKQGELAALETEFQKKCWAQKQKHDTYFAGAFEGFRNSAERFKAKVLQEFSSNSASLEDLADLKKRAETIFGTTPVQESVINIPDTETILSHESSSILAKRVIGKGDVDIAAMIQKLGNSDWVREGRSYYDVNGGICPFCQQQTLDSFTQCLNDYFDESFENDNKAITTLEANYKTESERLKNRVLAIVESASRFLDNEKLKSEKALLDSKIALNIQQIEKKKKESSQAIVLDSLANVASSIRELIDVANAQIADHNKMVTNLAQEKRSLTAQVWRYILDVELKEELVEYNNKKQALNKAITGLNEKIETVTKQCAEKATEIRDLEKDTASINPTIDAINSLLSSFGFNGFKLARAGSSAAYKLIRQDGSDAKETLSEGERTFITFLYFYYLLKGSESESGMTINRIAVIDDPVSSLDSDILFIVSSLIKGLFEEVRTNAGSIKQVFVLTHNVYFHKEVTFNPNRRDKALSEETFWVVRKFDSVSKLEKHSSNPIKTSYELLWSEVRNTDRSNLAIQNNLRRILENYFKILGGIDPDNICSKFEGKDKFVCKSLFSWVNDGSHSAHDELYASIDHSMVDTYLKVFREIFKKTDHFAHYKMMMGDAFVEEEESSATSEDADETLVPQPA